MSNYVSEISGNKYSKEEYINHGYGGTKHGLKDLPEDEYPYYYEPVEFLDKKVDLEKGIKPEDHHAKYLVERFYNWRENVFHIRETFRY